MTTHRSCLSGGWFGQRGTRAWVVTLVTVSLAGCASGKPRTAMTRPDPTGAEPIVRRPSTAELREGMRRSDVEDRVGLLLLRDQMGDMRVYVEPQTRCTYIFDRRDYLVDWSCR